MVNLIKKLKRNKLVEKNQNEEFIPTLEMIKNLWKKLELEKENISTLTKKLNESKINEANFKSIISMKNDEISRLKFQIDEIIKVNNKTFEMITQNAQFVADANRNGHFLTLEETDDSLRKQVQSRKKIHVNLTPKMYEEASTLVSISSQLDDEYRKLTCIQSIEKNGNHRTDWFNTDDLKIEFLDEYIPGDMYFIVRKNKEVYSLDSFLIFKK